MADGDQVPVLTDCTCVSLSFLKHNEEEMVEGQTKQRQTPLTCVCIKSTCSMCPADAGCMSLYFGAGTKRGVSAH